MNRIPALYGSRQRVLVAALRLILRLLAIAVSMVAARAVTVLAALDTEICSGSNGRKSLDDVMVALSASENAVTLGQFTALAREFTGAATDALSAGNLPD